MRYFDPDGRFAIVLPLCYYVRGVGFSSVSLSALTEIALWSAIAYLGYYTVDYLNEKIQQGQSSPPPSTSMQPLGNLPGYDTGKLLEECARQDFLKSSAYVNAKKIYPGYLPDDPSECPGNNWEWKGKGAPGSCKGAWVNRKTKENLHPDFNHPPPIGPHWDYIGDSGDRWRIDMISKRMVPKI